VTRRRAQLLVAGAVVASVVLPGGPSGAVAAPGAVPRIVCTLPPGASKLPVTTRHGLIGHLEQYPDPSLATAAERSVARRILEQIRTKARHWTTLAAAKRAGFETRTAHRRAGDETAHYLHAERRHERPGGPAFDPARP
jgi:hypothetical protein